MRAAVVLAVGSALFVLVGYGLLGGDKDRCELFGADLKLAVLEPTKAPDPDDRDPLTYGTCSTIETKKFDLEVLGWDRHSEHTIAGRIYLTPGGGGRQLLDATRASAEDEPGVRITPLRGVGPGAFVVTHTRPRPPRSDDFGGLPDPAGALSLPATAYWVNRSVFVSASATREGATIEQSRRATERLAELAGRRPVERKN